MEKNCNNCKYSIKGRPDAPVCYNCWNSSKWEAKKITSSIKKIISY